jgi:hypothetical protein
MLVDINTYPGLYGGGLCVKIAPICYGKRTILDGCCGKCGYKREKCRQTDE